MTYAIYQHDLAEVRLSEPEALGLQMIDDALRVPGLLPGELLAWAEARRAAMMADIEKVARWKFENGHG